MGARHEIPAYLTFIGCVVLASFQGARIDHLQESEGFYRWLINVAAQSHMGESLQFDQSAADAKDDEYFAKVVNEAETQLPSDMEVDEEADYDSEGNLRPSLVRHVYRSDDVPVWKFARAPENEDLREEFYDLASKGQLQSLGTQLTASDLYSHNVQGVGVTSMFLGFRQLAANFVWLQVDKYWHEGQVHRMLPLMRTCVTLDPHFIDAYLVGAWHMAYNITASMDDTPERDKELHPKYKRRLGPKEEWYYIAIDYLRDGIRKNPRDYRLYFDLGFEIYELKLNDHANAVRYLREARRYRHERWVPRMLFRSLTKNGQYEEAIEGWNEYLTIFPESDVAHEAIKDNMGLIAEAKYEEYIECAQEATRFAERMAEQAEAAELAGDLTQAAQLRRRATEAREDAEEMRELGHIERNTAMEIWREMEAGGRTFALARMLRLEALDALSEGRYLEAVAVLEAARFNHPEFFDEATDMILDIKVEHGLHTEVSEDLAIERRREAEMYSQNDPKPPVIHRVECSYRDMTGEGIAGEGISG